MATPNHPNNERLRKLVEESGLSQLAALSAFNQDQLRPISASAFKAWLAAPDAVRWRQLSDVYVHHAETVFKQK